MSRPSISSEVLPKGVSATWLNSTIRPSLSSRINASSDVPRMMRCRSSLCRKASSACLRAVMSREMACSTRRPSKVSSALLISTSTVLPSLRRKRVSTRSPPFSMTVPTCRRSPARTKILAGANRCRRTTPGTSNTTRSGVARSESSRQRGPERECPSRRRTGPEKQQSSQAAFCERGQKGAMAATQKSAEPGRPGERNESLLPYCSIRASAAWQSIGFRLCHSDYVWF